MTVVDLLSKTWGPPLLRCEWRKSQRFGFFFWWCFFFLFLIPLSGNTAEPGPFKVIGYFNPIGSPPSAVETIQYDYLTHINYAFLFPYGDGSFKSFDTTVLDHLVSLAHSHHVKVMISVGGWYGVSGIAGDDSAFHALASKQSTRKNFIDNLAGFIDAHRLDGADIDWEFPESKGRGDFILLMSGLSSRLHGKGKLLTAAVHGEGSYGVSSLIFPMVDFLNIMSYDHGGTAHSTYDFAVSSIDLWRGYGLPQEKTALGVPFYGRPGSHPYSSLVGRDASAPYKDQHGYEHVGEDYYNSIPTIQRKTTLAQSRAGGIMIWELTQDTSDNTSLLLAIHDAVGRDSSGSTR